MKYDFEVVLVGTDANTYYMARNFHEAYGKKSHVIGRVAMPLTSLSKIIELTIEKDLLKTDVFVKTLIDTAKKINKKKIILVGCTDDYVSLIIKNKDILKKYYLFNYTSNDLFETFVNKENFYNAYKDSILDLPKTFIYNVCNETNIDFINDFKFPIILKPSNIIKYHECEFDSHKVYKLYNKQELVNTISTIKSAGYDDKLIIQEFIPGDDSHLFDCVFYVSSKGKVQLQSFGQIGLQEHTKTGIGNLTVVINGYNEFGKTKEITGNLKKFLEKIKFNGICEFDLKYDERDNSFKVFEINSRQARSSYYLTACGFNLAKYLVDDLIYNKDKKYYLIDNEVCLSFVPFSIIKKYINNINYKNEVKKLKKEGLLIDPMRYKKDLSFKRRKYLFLRKINYIKKYKNSEWD